MNCLFSVMLGEERIDFSFFFFNRARYLLRFCSRILLSSSFYLLNSLILLSYNCVLQRRYDLLLCIIVKKDVSSFFLTAQQERLRGHFVHSSSGTILIDLFRFRYVVSIELK